VHDGALLALEDGRIYRGRSIGVNSSAVGEVVFNTAMTGYQEILTDPSYCQQIVTLTYPHIGNVGTNIEDQESGRVFAAGLVIRDLPFESSNWRASESLPEFLHRNEVVAIAGLDTRALTRVLREEGAKRACIMAGPALDEERALAAARAFAGLKGADLAEKVTTTTEYRWGEASWQLTQADTVRPADSDARWRVIAYDFGIKQNILRLLVDRNCELTVVPARTPASAVMERRPDGVFLSNGPGDPEPCSYAIDAIAELIQNGIPTFGICLGHQLLALACGAKTIKMKFGHHGANHPVKDLATGRVMITSQNHGFTVDESSLPEHLVATHRSLFDGSLQGVRHADKPAFGFQGHPEASPGPHDVRSLFDDFVDLMQNHRGS